MRSGSSIVGLLLVGYVLVRQMQPRPVRERSAARLPLVLLVLGALSLERAARGHAVPAIAPAVLAASLLLSVALGLVRASSMRLWRADGVLLRQGTWLTLSLWLASIAVHVGADALLRGEGRVAGDIGAASILLYLGLTLLVQRMAVQRRAQRLDGERSSGAPA